MSAGAAGSPRKGSLASKVAEVIPGAKLVEVRTAPRGRLGAQPSARAAGAEPPSSNTGVLSTKRSGREVFFDWLEGSFKGWSEDELMAEVAKWLPGEWYQSERGTQHYENRWIGPAGANVLSGNRGGSPEVHLVLPGKAMGAMGPDAQIEMVLWAFRKAKLSRLDVTMDDFEKVWVPEDLVREYEAGNCVTRVEDPLFYKKLKSGAATVEFGKPGGLRQLVCYDKSKESNGEVDSTRYEMRVRNEAATEFVSRCLERVGPRVMEFREEALPREFQRELVSLVDFRDRSVDVNSGRCPRLACFAVITEGAVKVRHVAVAVEHSIVRSIAYVKRSLAPLLSAVVAGRGGDVSVILDMLSDGRQRWSNQQRAMLREVGVMA